MLTFHERDDASVNEVSTLYKAVLFIGWRAFEFLVVAGCLAAAPGDESYPFPAGHSIKTL